MAGLTTTRRRPSPLAVPAGVALFLRRLRAERLLALVLAVVVLVTALVFAAMPRFYNSIADEGARHAIRDADTPVANVQMLEQRLQLTGQPTLRSDEAAAHGTELRADLPLALSNLFSSTDYVAQSAEFSIARRRGAPEWPQYFVRMRYQSALADHVSIVDGRLPKATDETVSRTSIDESGKRIAVEVPVVEVAVAADALETAKMRVGDRLDATLSQDSQVFIGGLVRTEDASDRVMAEIVGSFEASEADEPYWYGDVLPLRANITGSLDRPMIHVIGLMADRGLDRLVSRESVAFEYRWQFFVDPERIDAGSLDAVNAAVKKVRADYPSFVNRFNDTTALRTGLDTVFRQFEAQRRLTEAMLAIVAIGLLAVAMLVIGLIGALIADRRRTALVLQRGRGASSWQILGAQAVEGLLLSVPAVAVGAGVALLVPARASVLTPLLAAGIAAGATVLLVAIALPVARGRLGQLERGDQPVRAVSVRRLVFEALAVVLAVGGVYLIRRRGLGGEAGSTGFDPFLAAVPVLAGLATGLVVLRIYPFPIRFLAWLASLGRGFVAVFALRRVGRQPGASNLPLMVLLLTVAVGVFSSVLLTTIERGQSATAWQQVGAPYRAQVTFAELPKDLDLGKVPGVEAAARAYLARGVTFDMKGSDNALTLDAVDAPALASVTSGTPADPHLPPGLLDEPTEQNNGTEQAPLPAIVSTHAATGPREMQQGDRFELLVEQTWISFVVVDVREVMPGIVPGTQFVVTSLEQLQAAYRIAPLPVTTVFIRAPASAEPALRRALDGVVPETHLTSQAAALGELQGSPLIAGVAAGFRLTLVVAALYSALAVIVALVLTAAERARDLAFLRTLGLGRGQGVGVLVLEQVPAVLVAVLSGIGLGIAVAFLIAPGLDLRAFTGASTAAVLRVDLNAAALIGLAVVAVVAIAVAATAIASRRRNLGSALRVGE